MLSAIQEIPEQDKKDLLLFLDDLRNPKDVIWVNLPEVEWTVVRNYDDFVNTIIDKGVPTRISFDHDLADEHYRESM